MKPKLTKIAAVSALIVLLMIFQSTVIASKKPTKKIKAKPYFNRIIVKFKKGISKKQKNRIIAKVGKLTKASAANPLYIISPKKPLPKALKILRGYKQVQYASADYKRKLFYTPTDPQYSLSQWNLAAIKVPNAWDSGESEGWLNNAITVASIDTGIDSNHPDLAANLWVNSDEIASNSIDDDSNGYVDDRNGYSWAALSNMPANSSGDFNLGAKYPEDGVKAVAQSINGTGGKIKSMGFWISINEKLPNKNITVSLKTSSSSRPGSTLASFTIKPSDIPYDADSEEYGGWVEKPLSQEVTLTQGTQYFIVLETANYSSSAYYTFDYSRGGLVIDNNGFVVYEEDSYTGGNLFFRRNNVYIEKPKTDLVFASDTTGTDITDEYGHGSLVSGVIGAVHNNAGGAGIVPEARLMTLRVGNKDGSISDQAIIEAINYAVDNGAKVINLSLGSSFYSAAVQEATDYAYNNGVTVVAAAGNDGDEVDNYPASNRNVISVGATVDNNSLASFSTLSDNVDVVAPGQDIYTTDNEDGYSAVDGTSFSSSTVAGVAALIKLKNPTWNAAAIASRISNTATDLGRKYRDMYYGHGQVNLQNAFGSTNFSKIDTSKKTDIYYGTVVPLAAYLKVGNWSPSNALAGATIKGQFKLYGFPLWLPLTEGTTNANGKISSFIAPSENTEVRFAWDGNASYQRASNEFTIYVRALVHINITRLGNRKVRISGKVSPEHRGRVTLLRRLPGGSWKTIAKDKLDADSHYSFVTKLRKGTNWYRVKFGGDEDHRAGISILKKIKGK